MHACVCVCVGVCIAFSGVNDEDNTKWGYHKVPMWAEYETHN